MKSFIPTAVYGVLNYIIALTLIASPWLFGFNNVSSAALFMPIYMGWLQLIMAIFLNNETGFIKQFPIKIHFVIEVAMGFILAVSPFLYTFSWKESFGQACVPVLFGLLLMFLGIFTHKSPFTDKAHAPLEEGTLVSTENN